MGVKIFAYREKIDDLAGLYLDFLDRHALSAEAEDIRARIGRINEDEKLVITFIGQYSAGKSTMISALTERKDIKIDADIATQDATRYLFKDQIALVDTPGLYTGNSEHDDITIDAIAESDMLVYCITSELFNDVTVRDYKRWVYDKGYLAKTILVINKMSREDGEFEELRANYIDSINSSLSPASIYDIKHSFVDAREYMESDDEELMALSNFQELKDIIDEQAASMGLYSRLDTHLKLLASSVNNVLTDSLEDNFEKDQLRLINNIHDEIELATKSLSSKAKALLGDNLTRLYSQALKEATQLLPEEADDTIRGIIVNSCQTINEELDEIFAQEREKLEINLTKIGESSLAGKFLEGLNNIGYSYEGGANLRSAVAADEGVEVLSGLIGVVYSRINLDTVFSQFITMDNIQSLDKINQNAFKLVEKFPVEDLFNLDAKKLSSLSKSVGKALGAAAIVVEIYQLYDSVTNKSGKNIPVKELSDYQAARKDYVAALEEINADLERDYLAIVDDYLEGYRQVLARLQVAKDKVQDKLVGKDGLEKELLEIQADIKLLSEDLLAVEKLAN